MLVPDLDEYPGYSFTTSICLSITCPVNRSIATWTR